MERLPRGFRGPLAKNGDPSASENQGRKKSQEKKLPSKYLKELAPWITNFTGMAEISTCRPGQAFIYETETWNLCLSEWRFLDLQSWFKSPRIEVSKSLRFLGATGSHSDVIHA